MILTAGYKGVSSVFVDEERRGEVIVGSFAKRRKQTGQICDCVTWSVGVGRCSRPFEKNLDLYVYIGPWNRVGGGCGLGGCVARAVRDDDCGVVLSGVAGVMVTSGVTVDCLRAFVSVSGSAAVEVEAACLWAGDLAMMCLV